MIACQEGWILVRTVPDTSVLFFGLCAFFLTHVRTGVPFLFLMFVLSNTQTCTWTIPFHHSGSFFKLDLSLYLSFSFLFSIFVQAVFRGTGRGDWSRVHLRGDTMS